MNPFQSNENVFPQFKKKIIKASGEGVGGKQKKKVSFLNVPLYGIFSSEKQYLYHT